MGSSLATRLAQYRLIFIQPDPENGDRVCVGVLLEDRNSPPEVIYDIGFSKVRCVAPTLDIELLRFYVEDLKKALRGSSDPGLTLQQYAPQLTTSQPRTVVTPVTDTVKTRLLERYAVIERPSKLAAAEAKLRASSRTAAEIQRLVERMAAPLNLRIVKDASAADLFGRPIPDLKTVAIGIISPTKLIVVDGVDLRHLTPKRSLSQTNRVVHTFWQYGRLRNADISVQQKVMQRVGVILNGVIPDQRRVREYIDAHDYARDQFSKESEMTVDTSSSEATDKLAAVLATATE